MSLWMVDLNSWNLATTTMKACGGLLPFVWRLVHLLKWKVFRINNQQANKCLINREKLWSRLKYDLSCSPMSTYDLSEKQESYFAFHLSHCCLIEITQMWYFVPAACFWRFSHPDTNVHSHTVAEQERVLVINEGKSASRASDCSLSGCEISTRRQTDALREYYDDATVGQMYTVLHLVLQM